jgi:hypothetical protein
MISVSDHAIVRYLERVGGFDIDRLRQQIASRISEAAKAGASAVVVDGYEYVIQIDASGHPIVATVLKPSQQKRRKRR